MPEENLHDYLAENDMDDDWKSIAKLMIENGIIAGEYEYAGTLAQCNALLAILTREVDEDAKEGEEEGLLEK